MTANGSGARPTTSNKSGRSSASTAAKAVTVVVLFGGLYNNFHSIPFNPFAGGSKSWRLDDNESRLLAGNCSGSESSFLMPPLPPPLSSVPEASLSAGPSFAWNTTSALLDTCYYVEDICHTSHRWFYRPTTSSGKRQPDVLLHYEMPSLRTYVGNIESAYEATYRFRRLANDSSHLEGLRCVDSTTTNHIVLYSVYNEMLGEFYDRSLLFLWLLSKEHEWVRHSQLYLHLYMPTRRLMDSHHLFTNPFRTMPLMDFATLMDETNCRCLPRLIFCGYGVEIREEARRKTRRGSKNAQASVANRVVELTPGEDLMGRPTREHHRPFQRELRKAVVLHNPHARDDIKAFRDSMLDEEKIPIEERYAWKIVGLTQRSSRRRWRNLDLVMDEAFETMKRHKILLVEVNVEEDGFSPYQHVVWHAALDGLVGIHGAQLTDAIWMRPGSWVVELLPFVPDKIIMGSWTKKTSGPTPLGEIFDGTDLNHAGHPLGRDSAPYCHGLEGAAYLDCWKITRNPWDKRDFLMEPQALVKVLLGTVALAVNTTRCQDFQQRGAKKDGVLVMYNIHCAKDDRAPITLNHFYW